MTVKVFIVDHVHQADYKVFFVKHKHQEENHQIIAGGKIVKHKHQANIKIMREHFSK